jgi:histidine triad (HIT) family protein
MEVSMKETGDCIFCKIALNEIPAARIFEGENIVAFEDINPQAPEHIILIPRRHIASINDLRQEDGAIISELVLTAGRIAKERGIDQSGYRIVLNCNRDGGQTVFHIHAHLLGGRLMEWPPG